MTIQQRIKELQKELDELIEMRADQNRIIKLSKELDTLIEDFMMTRNSSVKTDNNIILF